LTKISIAYARIGRDRPGRVLSIRIEFTSADGDRRGAVVWSRAATPVSVRLPRDLERGRFVLPRSESCNFLG